jgi:hypothetical protein
MNTQLNTIVTDLLTVGSFDWTAPSVGLICDKTYWLIYYSGHTFKQTT